MAKRVFTRQRRPRIVARVQIRERIPNFHPICNNCFQKYSPLTEYSQRGRIFIRAKHVLIYAIIIHSETTMLSIQLVCNFSRNVQSYFRNRLLFYTILFFFSINEDIPTVFDVIQQVHWYRVLTRALTDTPVKTRASLANFE